MTSMCNFFINKPHGIYHTGETIDGSIVLNMASSKTIDGIYISLCGEGTVFWKKHGNSLQRNRNRRASLKITEYKADELYDGPRQELMGVSYLQPGQYNFNFSLEIPLKCPSSFEGSLGLIRYYLLVAVCSSKCFNIEFKHPVNIIRTDDLNENREHKIPLRSECFKSNSSYSCLADNLLISFVSPYSAYVPRQKLPYTLYIENNSKKDVYAYGISIEQKILYISRQPRKNKYLECNEVYSKKFVEKCSRATSREIKGEVEIPDVTPSSEGENCIINIQYVIMVSVYISGSTKTLNMSIPIHIGTIPIIDGFTPANTVPSAPQLLQLMGEEVENPMLALVAENTKSCQDLISLPVKESSGITYPRTFDGIMVCPPEKLEINK